MADPGREPIYIDPVESHKSWLVNAEAYISLFLGVLSLFKTSGSATVLSPYYRTPYSLNPESEWMWTSEDALRALTHLNFEAQMDPHLYVDLFSWKSTHSSFKGLVTHTPVLILYSLTTPGDLVAPPPPPPTVPFLILYTTYSSCPAPVAPFSGPSHGGSLGLLTMNCHLETNPLSPYR